MVLFQALFFASLTAVAWLFAPDRTAGLMHGALAYLVVYLYGMASLAVLVATLRAVAEHQPRAGDELRIGQAALRNLRAGPLSRLIFGCYGFAEHGSHHLEPAVPAYHLPVLSRRHAAADSRLEPRSSYWSILRQAVAAAPAPEPALSPRS